MSIEAIKRAMKSNPELNSTELAQMLAGGWNGSVYPEYADILHKINKIKAS